MFVHDKFQKYLTNLIEILHTVIWSDLKDYVVFISLSDPN